MILAPLRGVTIRSFRETFADEIRVAGFTEAITPFITANAGYDPVKDRELRGRDAPASSAGRDKWCGGVSPPQLKITPQFIGKDPDALRTCLEKIKAADYDTADLNCGCPFPMVRNKGRGSGILRTPDVLRRMLEVGCEVMGPRKFSIKARLGVDRSDELLKLMPLINEFPLRFLTVHARTARQMYEGSCDVEMVERVEKVAKVPIVINGDIPFPPTEHLSTEAIAKARTVGISPTGAGRGWTDRPAVTTPVGENAGGTVEGFAIISTSQSLNLSTSQIMIGRSFVRWLGTREDSGELLNRYIAASQAELCGDRSVLGRMKELVSYWKGLPRWMRRWDVIKMCRTVDELRSCLV